MNRSTRTSLVFVALGLTAAVVGPAACFFPSDYDFTPTGAGGSGGAGSTLSTTSDTTTMSTSTNTTTISTTTTSTGGGGSTSMSSSSTGNPSACDPVDCSSQECKDAGYSCAPAVPTTPTGWTGYFRVFEGKASADPGCSNAFDMTAYTGNSDIDIPDTGCECSCSVINPTCAMPQGLAQNTTSPVVTLGPILSDVMCGDGPNCGFQFGLPIPWTGACSGTSYLAGGQLLCGPNTVDCTQTTGDPCNVSVSVPSAVASGTCGNPAQNGTPDPSSWTNVAHACQAKMPTNTGCSDQSTSCVQIPADPFVNGICIMQTGDVACPGGSWTAKHVYYTNILEGRSCNDDCTCPNDAINGDCVAHFSIYKDMAPNTCTNLVTTVDSGQCVELSGNPEVGSSMKATFDPPTGLTCQAQGGGVMGTDTPDPASATTFCCIP